MERARFTIRAQHHLIDYVQPALLQEEVELTTWLSDLDHSGAVRHHTVTRVSDAELLVRARSRWSVHELGSEVPIAIPEAFLVDLSPSMATNSGPQGALSGADGCG